MMGKMVVYSLSLSDRLFLVYRHTRDFCVLILFPATLLNSLMSSSGFLVASLGFCMCSIMSPENSDTFTSFQFGFLFISFSSLIVVTRTSKTLLNKSSESGHPCLVLDLSGNAFNFFTIEYDDCCGHVIYGVYYVEVFSHMPIFWRDFIINGC